MRRLGEVLEPLPGSKSVVLIGYGFDHGFTRYERALDALDAARAAVFSLDVTQADYHTFEHALRDVSHHTGGLFLTTFDHPRRAIERVANAVGGRYVLFTRAPDLERGFPFDRRGAAARRRPRARPQHVRPLKEGERRCRRPCPVRTVVRAPMQFQT